MGATRWSASGAWLDTQFGDAGHGARRPSRTPRAAGGLPARRLPNNAAIATPAKVGKERAGARGGRRDGHSDRVRPPSTRRLCPVRYAASGDSRKATVFAISSARPYRAAGIVARMGSCTGRVSIKPGNTLFIRILCFSSWSAYILQKLPSAERIADD